MLRQGGDAPDPSLLPLRRAAAGRSESLALPSVTGLAARAGGAVRRGVVDNRLDRLQLLAVHLPLDRHRILAQREGQRHVPRGLGKDLRRRGVSGCVQRCD
jgi:hypothetical protein